MWKHNQNESHRYEASEPTLSQKQAGSQKVPAALPHDGAASRMNDEGGPNEAVVTVPTGPGTPEFPAMWMNSIASEEQNGGHTTLIFTIQITAHPRYSGDGINEHYVAQAVAPNGQPLHYRGEGPTLSSALQQLVDTTHTHHKNRPGAK